MTKYISNHFTIETDLWKSLFVGDCLDMEDLPGHTKAFQQCSPCSKQILHYRHVHQ